MGNKEVNDSDRSGPQPWASAIPQAANNAATRKGPGPLVWVLFGILGLLALAVVFVLPGVVAQYELPFTPRAPLSESAPVASPTSSIAISPFEEAQRARQRQEAQQVLASLLERQKALDALAVTQWAQAPYEAALAAARQGDEFYRKQTFADAGDQYRAADAALAALQEQLPKVYEDAMQQGRVALQEGAAALAKERFTLALAVRPRDQDAQAGLGRAQSLDEVANLLDEARNLRDAGKLAEALASVQRASALDGTDQDALSLARELRNLQADQAFNAVMSEGFNALQAGNSDAAIRAFERALSMRPGSTQAQEAITQTRDQLAVTQITGHRSKAEALVAQEQWAAAVEEYDAALEVDGNLVFALEGKDYAQKRLQLDGLLQDAIEQPTRLAATAVYEQTVQVYYTGRNIDNAGQRLLGQLDTLEDLLNKAQVPVEVQLVSDNQTEVTLYQVGVLGRFSNQVLTLKPGKYVAVGTKPGYRDVRTEFEVGFDQRSAPVAVACTEKIAAVNRR